MDGQEAARKPDEPESQELEAVSLKLGARRLGELANEAGYGNRRIPLTRRGKVIAALVGMRDLKRLQELDASAA